VIPGLHVIEGGQTSTGSVVRWLNSSVVGEAGWPGYESLNAAAAELPPGCEGLLCCDHFQVSTGCWCLENTRCAMLCGVVLRCVVLCVVLCWVLHWAVPGCDWMGAAVPRPLPGEQGLLAVCMLCCAVLGCAASCVRLHQLSLCGEWLLCCGHFQVRGFTW
jgi:hypothetical protein